MIVVFRENSKYGEYLVGDYGEVVGFLTVDGIPLVSVVMENSGFFTLAEFNHIQRAQSIVNNQGRESRGYHRG